MIVLFDLNVYRIAQCWVAVLMGCSDLVAALFLVHCEPAERLHAYLVIALPSVLTGSVEVTCVLS